MYHPLKLDELQIDDYILKMMNLHNIPGMTIGIGKNGRLVYSKGYGFKNIETQEEMNSSVIFHMASITKLFVGTSIMQLMEKGRIDINRPVIDYLSYFNIKDKRGKSITVAQMLSHTSGMPDCFDYEWENPEFDRDALERYVKKQSHLELMWDPGIKFAYSNIAYEVLGDLIAKVSNMSFEEYVEESIFKPLTMNNSSLLTFQRNMEEIVAPHIKDEKGRLMVSKIFPYNRIHGPSSTLTSNVEDLFKWASAHLNKGEYQGKRILEKKTYELMWKPICKINDKEDICLSWFTRIYRDLKIYGHEGNDIGFRNSFALFPDEQMSISVHANIITAPTRRIQKGIIDLLMGYEAQLR